MGHAGGSYLVSISIRRAMRIRLIFDPVLPGARDLKDSELSGCSLDLIKIIRSKTETFEHCVSYYLQTKTCFTCRWSQVTLETMQPIIHENGFGSFMILTCIAHICTIFYCL